MRQALMAFRGPPGRTLGEVLADTQPGALQVGQQLPDHEERVVVTQRPTDHNERRDFRQRYGIRDLEDDGRGIQFLFKRVIQPTS